ncbi:MAG TPA: DUF4397 domain-containing protein, partial [Terriglobales bacterium]|nr:DUF4397 domain-containing protein [Terriglobales bacterium]
VLEDGNSVASSLAYGTSTGYISVRAGSHQIQIEPSGTSSVFLTQTLSFSSGTDTTQLSFNFSSSPQALVLTDDNSAPPSGDAKLRLINVSPSLGPADVYIVSPGTDINTVSPTISNLAFGAASGYQSLTASSYEIIYAFAGQKVVAIDSGSLSFSAGQVRSFVGLNGQSGGFTDALLADVN